MEKVRAATRPGVNSKVVGKGSGVVGNRDPQWHCTTTRTGRFPSDRSRVGNDTVVSCIVMDPFSGAGNVLKVAVSNRRRAIGNDLNEKFVELSRRRVGNVIPKVVF